MEKINCLVKLLQKYSYTEVTANQLAFELDVTPRTIKNYIRKLREQGAIITSSKNGYNLKRISEGLDNYLPDSSEQRINFLIRKLLIDDHTINVYDMAEELFINSVEIRNYFYKIRDYFHNYDLRLERKGDDWTVLGDKKDFRKAISATVYNEIQNSNLTTSKIANFFTNVSVCKIENILRDELEKTNIYYDDYEFNNLLLHVVIIISDASNCSKYKYKSKVQQMDQLTMGIIDKIQSELNISIDKQSIETINDILHDMTYLPEKNKDLDSFIHRLIETVLSDYDINLDSNLFREKFSAHLQRLIIRASKGMTVHNPISENIKNSSPLIYDCAVTIANAVEQQYGVKIKDDEIGFIALHIGNIIQDQIALESKVVCQIFVSDYNNNSQKIIDELNKSFTSEIKILNTINDTSQVLPETELIIVVDNSIESIKDSVNISSFFTVEDKNRVLDHILKIKKDKDYLIIKKGLSNYLDQNAFFKVTKELNSRKKVLDKIADYARTFGESKEILYRNFCSREALSSTAFDKIAIPHIIVDNIKHGGWQVIINKNGIDWDGQIVYLVLAMVISKRESADFRRTFSSLSIAFLNGELIRKLINSNNRNEFVKILEDYYRDN